MPRQMVTIRHIETGQTAEVAEEAAGYYQGWRRTDAEPTPTETASTSGEQPAGDTTPPTTTRRRAAARTTTEGDD